MVRRKYVRCHTQARHTGQGHPAGTSQATRGSTTAARPATGRQTAVPTAANGGTATSRTGTRQTTKQCYGHFITFLVLFLGSGTHWTKENCASSSRRIIFNVDFRLYCLVPDCTFGGRSAVEGSRARERPVKSRSLL